jgi:hypothetical protein
MTYSVSDISFDPVFRSIPDPSQKKAKSKKVQGFLKKRKCCYLSSSVSFVVNDEFFLLINVFHINAKNVGSCSITRSDARSGINF